MSSKDTRNQKFIAIFCPYPQAGAPSQRFRYEQYLDILHQHQVRYEIFSFLDAHTNAILYRKGHTLQKGWGVLKGFFRRFSHLFQSRKAHYILLHREAAPLGPPVFEWMMAKVMGKKIVYDFDDAIWLPNISGVNRIAARLKWHQKVAAVCRWSYKVSAGNAYLCEYASQFNQRVVLNPTTLDTEHLHNRIQDQAAEIPVIGWTGSHSTMMFLDQLVPTLQRLSEAFTFRVVVISNRAPAFALPQMEFVPWKKETEIEDLLRFHIGVMPLTQDPWSEGKCGFKALQYLSLGIPAVVSPVGVNQVIVEQGINGFLCSTEDEWYDALATLMKDATLRAKMGTAGRKRIEDRYSVKANQKNFLGLFE